jgi:hypothetical protein
VLEPANNSLTDYLRNDAIYYLPRLCPRMSSRSSLFFSRSCLFSSRSSLVSSRRFRARQQSPRRVQGFDLDSNFYCYQAYLSMASKSRNQTMHKKGSTAEEKNDHRSSKKIGSADITNPQIFRKINPLNFQSLR